MVSESQSNATSTPESYTTASKLLAVGSELFREIQTHVGSSRVKSLRLTLGGRPIKDIAVSPATAIASLFFVVAAVVVTNLRIEVIKDTDVTIDKPVEHSSSVAPGGAQ